MNSFRKKPVIVQAELYDGSAESIELITKLAGNRHFDVHNDHLDISTLEGVMRADIGDYIIRGVSGEIYPCKPDIFNKTYQKI